MNKNQITNNPSYWNNVLPPAIEELWGSEGILTLTDVPGDTETVVIGAKTYTFQTTLTDVDGNVLIGATIKASLENLIAAINLEVAEAGTKFAASMTAHPTANAKAEFSDEVNYDDMRFMSSAHIAVTETLTNGSWAATPTAQADREFDQPVWVTLLAAGVLKFESNDNSLKASDKVVVTSGSLPAGWTSPFPINKLIATGTTVALNMVAIHKRG